MLLSSSSQKTPLIKSWGQGLGQLCYCVTSVFPDLHFRASALHMRISKLRAPRPTIANLRQSCRGRSSIIRSTVEIWSRALFQLSVHLVFYAFAAPGWRSCKQSLQGGGWVDSADRGGWQSVKRNIPRPKKVGGPLLAAERIPGCNLSAATWCRSTQREIVCGHF